MNDNGYKKKINIKKVFIALVILIAIVISAVLFIQINKQKAYDELVANTKKQYEFYLNNETIENSEDETKNILSNINKEKEKNNQINFESFINNSLETKILNEENVKNIISAVDNEIQKYDLQTLNNFTKENILNTVNNEKIDKETLGKIYEENDFIKNLDSEIQKRTEYIEKLKEFKNELTYFENNKSSYYFKNNKYICKNNESLNQLNNFSNKYNLNYQIIKEQKSTTSSGVPILCYHGVLDKPWGISELFVKVDEFEAQMRYLSEQGYTPIFVSEIANANKYEKPIIITFDDGYQDVYTNAFPILKKYNIKANVYMISGWICGGVYMTEEMTKEMAESPLIEIGSHTVTHKALATLSKSDIEYELSQSKKTLEEMLGKEINVLAYPTGSYDNRVIECAKKYYKYALSTIDGKENPERLNTYTLKRIYVYRKYNIEQFKRLF